MSGLKFFYGSYVHPAGEAYPRKIEVVPVFTPDGNRWASRVRYEVAGEFCSDPQSEFDPTGIETKIAAFNAAYSVDNKDFGFRLSDDTPTSHIIQTDNILNLSGNKVLSRSWDYMAPNEFANTRSFTVALGALMLEDYSQIMYFKETVEQIGNGGPLFSYRPRWSGAPILEPIHAQTPVTLRQYGVYATLSPGVNPPAPWWPASEQGSKRRLTRRSGRLHGHPSFAKPTEYVTEYSYEFLLDSPPGTTPNDWI